MAPTYPAVERTLNCTDPLPCQRTPTRSNRPGELASDRSASIGTSRNVIVARPAEATAGAASAAATAMRARSGFTAEIPG